MGTLLDIILKIASYAAKRVCWWARKPKVEQPYASIAIHHPNTRTCSGRFLISNPGPRICNIKQIRLLGNIPLPELNLVAIGQWPGHSVNDINTQKLPLSIQVDEPNWVFFRTREVTEVYKGDLPQTLVMEIDLDRVRKPIRRELNKEPNRHQYTED